MRIPSARLLLPISGLLCVACTEGPKQYLVPDVRILAIRDHVAPSSPLADAGPINLTTLDQVDVEALVANPRGRAPITVDWYRCDPWLRWVPSGPIPSCIDPEQLAHPDTFPTAPGVVSLGGGVVPPGISSTSLVTIDLNAFSAQVSNAFAALLAAASVVPTLQCQLYVDLPIVAIARADGIAEVAVKRVRLTPTTLQAATSYRPNLNPVVSSIAMSPADPETCAGGVAVSTPLPAGKVTLCATATPGSIDLYWQCQDGAPPIQLGEALDWQWYVSAGRIDNASFSGNASGVHIELTAPSGPFTLWTIVRDGNGGSDWMVSSLSGP